MAEGWARHLGGENLEAASAGTQPKGLDPRAVQVMAEAGVDISKQVSKGLEAFRDETFDLVVTVCHDADASCPSFPGGTEVRHRGFVDPARAKGSPEEVLEVFRRVRDEIRAYVETLG